MWTIRSEQPEDTRAFARALGDVAAPRTIIALVGPLGAGKTCFVQGLAQALGVAGPVVSPTFVILAEHEERLLHADLYRVAPDELAGIGFEDAVHDWPGVVAIEWADRAWDALPADRLEVRFDRPHLHVEATGPVHERLLERWRERHGA